MKDWTNILNTLHKKIKKIKQTFFFLKEKAEPCVVNSPLQSKFQPHPIKIYNQFCLFKTAATLKTYKEHQVCYMKTELNGWLASGQLWQTLHHWNHVWCPKNCQCKTCLSKSKLVTNVYRFHWTLSELLQLNCTFTTKRSFGVYFPDAAVTFK